jgi:hypothetical protein
VGLGATLFAGSGLRFPRAGGIPAILIIAVVSVAGPLVMRPFVPIRGTGRLASLQLLALDDSEAFVAIDDWTPGAEDTPRVSVLGDSTVVARAEHLAISKYLFFLGADAGMALVSIENPGSAAEYGSALGEAPMIEWMIRRLPLLGFGEMVSEPQPLGLLREYEVAGLADGRLRITPVSPSE